jgi:DNA polymerase-1
MDEPLYLLDGYSIIYRSYFAFIRNPLRNAEGRNTSAIFGFFRTLLKLLHERKPAYFAVVMDSLTPTFRHEQYAEYKATREKTPEDLHSQVPIVEEILSAMGIPILRVNGFEADDVMASAAELCAGESRPCYVISGDKDMLQVVDGGVTVLRPDKDGSYREMSAEAVEAEWGVRPDQMVDYLALTGDSSDNIPGVSGVGAKTASKLLGQFGTLDEVYAHLDQVSSKSWRSKLEAGKESAYLSRSLVVLRRDAPLACDMDALHLGPLDNKAAAEILLREGIKSIAEELGGSGEVDMPEQRRGVYEAVTDLETLDAWIAHVRERGVYAFDVETNAIDPMVAEPVGFSIAVEPGRACYVPIRCAGAATVDAEVVKERLASVLEDPSLRMVGQNTKFDYQVLRRWGIPAGNIWFDTMIAAWLLNSSLATFNMDRLAEDVLNYRTVHYDEVVEKGATFDSVPLGQAAEYAAEDADITYRLYQVFQKQLGERGLQRLFHEMEMPLVTLLADMEHAGIRIVPERLSEYSAELAKKLAAIEREIYDLCGREFNIGSTKQLQQVLFQERKLKPGKRTKTGYSTDTSVLEELAAEDPVPALVLRHRMLAKLKSTYVDALPTLVNPETNRIHTSFMQTGTATGRLSSRDPNLQNIPIRDEEGRRIRSAFVPEDGWSFLSADYSQIELVLLAHLSQDPNLLRTFSEDKDVHRQTAALIFEVPEEEVTPEQRRIGKTINFGVMYGMSAFRLSRELRIPRADAERFISAYFEKYAGITAFIDRTVSAAKETLKVTTLQGHEREVPRITSRNRTERMAAERIAVNTPIQGSAADIVKMAMLRIRERLRGGGYQARLLLQVHDELIFEVPDREVEQVRRLVQEVMEQAVALSIPLRVNIEVGGSWGELH